LSEFYLNSFKVEGEGAGVRNGERKGKNAPHFPLQRHAETLMIQYNFTNSNIYLWTCMHILQSSYKRGEWQHSAFC